MKKIISLSILLAMALAAAFLFAKYAGAPSDDSQASQTDDSFSPISIKPKPIDISLPFSNDPKDVAWSLFQKYLSYNKAKDLEGVKSSVYRIAPVCENPETRIDCEARMGSAYSYGKNLEKKDFTDVWSDDKQMILSTEWKIQEDDTSIGRNRAIIYFVKGQDDEWKLLSYSPFKGAVVAKDSASRDEVIDWLTTWTEDKDQDGISDYDEECLAAKASGQICSPTNPKLRDTDSNGLWDGIDSLMR